MNISEILMKLANGSSLDLEESGCLFNSVMNGELTPAQTGALLGIMSTRQPTVDELVGAARAMRDAAVHIQHDLPLVLDTCGTGGDHAGTFNISTCTAFVVAAAGVPVAKHGNRSASSKCGGADLLEAMGWDLDAEPEKLEKCLRDTNFTFLFARKMHPAMRHVAPIRSELKIRTIFNYLGPMTNPASANRQLVGISDHSMLDSYAHALSHLDVDVAMVVSARDGLDEISLTAPTDVVEWRNGEVLEYTLEPEELGLQCCQIQDLAGGDAAENFRITQEIFRDKVPGPKQDAVILNAGASLYVASQASNIRKAIEHAREIIQSGQAWAKVEEVLSTISG